MRKEIIRECKECKRKIRGYVDYHYWGFYYIYTKRKIRGLRLEINNFYLCRKCFIKREGNFYINALEVNL